MRRINNVRNFKEMLLAREEEIGQMEKAAQRELADDAYQLYLEMNDWVIMEQNVSTAHTCRRDDVSAR